MRKYLTAALALCLIALGASSCRRDRTTPAEVKEELSRRSVAFTATGEGFGTKATETGFVNGDVIGIFAPDMERYNVKGTIQGTAVSPEVPIRWAAGQENASSFYAYYPYSESLESTTASFAIKEDQSSADSYNASDLRAAHVYAQPLTSVDFVLAHCFSKLTVALGSKVSGETATSVVFKNMIADATVDLASGGAAKGQTKADITALKLSDTRFAAILIPQTYLEIEVVTNKGRTLKYSTYKPVSLEGGYAYQADLMIPEAGHETTEIEFTITLVDWEDGGAIPYGNSKQEGL